MTAPTDSHIDHFYRAAGLGLATLEAREPRPRRFGPDADARWRAFRGELGGEHRLDLLVREAAVAHPAGFAPRAIFALPGLANDEPFGPGWTGAPRALATDILGRVQATAALAPLPLLTEVARIWELAPRMPENAPAVTPTSRLVIAGAGAVLAVARAFVGQPGLDMTDQVTLVADDPGTRQLFGLALAALGSRTPARRTHECILATTAAASRPGQVMISSDAPDQAATAARRIAREPGASS
jgi:hypothetical protein